MPFPLALLGFPILGFSNFTPCFQKLFFAKFLESLEQVEVEQVLWSPGVELEVQMDSFMEVTVGAERENSNCFHCLNFELGP